MYFSGKFVEQDQDFAFLLYEMSEAFAKDRYPSLALRLAECYCYGIGTYQDLDDAVEYLDIALEEYEHYIGMHIELKMYKNGLSRARKLLKLIKNDKIPVIPVGLTMEKHYETYFEFLYAQQDRFPEPHYPIEMLEQLKKENPIVTFPEKREFNTMLSHAEAGDEYDMYNLACDCMMRFENEPSNKEIMNFVRYYLYKSACAGGEYALVMLASIYEEGVHVE